MELKNVPKYAILFIVIAIVLSNGATILSQFKATPTNVGSASLSDSNTVTLYNGSYATTLFGDLDVKGNLPLGCSNVNIYNGTNALNATADFTISGCYAYTKNATAYNNTAKQVNYTLLYQTYTYSYNITEQGEQVQSNLSSWQNIWVVIAAASIVLGLIGGFLYFKG